MIMTSNGTPRAYNGRNYYPVTPDISAPVVYIDKLKLREMLYADLPNDDRIRDLYAGNIRVRMLINENGDIDGFQQTGGALKIPVNEKKELLNFRVQSPASYNGENIPSFIELNINVQEIIR